MKNVTIKLLTHSLAVSCAAWITLGAHAAGLGALSVQSALGQPLIAEVEVTSLQADEFARVLARIASPEDYQAAKLTFTPTIRQIRVTPERRKDGKTILKITSFAPVNEPTLDLLVDFNWRGGRLLQKYSVLLDPPK
jgi:pilus assembly protein FimV